MSKPLIKWNGSLYQFFGNFEKIVFNDSRYLVEKGGAGSGKSHGIAQKLLYRCLTEQDANHRFLVIRKTQPSLRKSCFNLIKDKIKAWGVEPLFTVRDYDMQIKCNNGNSFLFVGLDDPEKLKSIERITSVWIEEATELKKTDFLQIDLRLRGEFKYYKQIILSFNPVDEQSWINEMFFKKEKDGAFIHETTVDDNIFADPDYVKILDSLADEDENYYNIYRKGLWGVLKGVIYTKFKTIQSSEWPKHFDEIIYGLDFGFNNPSALVQVGVRDGEYYLKELLYETKLTNSDLILKLNELIENKNDYLYADTAEPARIDEIRRAGYNVYPSNKSVKD